MLLTPELKAEIESHLRQKIVSLAPLSAANTAQIYRATTDSGKTFVAKVAESGMDVEGWMLGYLRERSSLPVPGVYYSNAHMMLMEFVGAYHSFDERAHVHAAECLAGLHGVTADQYGLERDTLVASLPQPNAQSADWPAFFAEHRLLHMAKEALREGKIDKDFMKQTEKLSGKLGRYLAAPGKPSLIHGDVWGGNLIPGNGKIAAFLDPAIYYADAEIELAFIKLLNTFGDAFWNRYNELRPIQKGFFEERAEIYALYPLLIHARLFGSSYARKAKKILDRFV